MKIIDKTGPLPRPTVSSNDIPVGTVFRGNVWGVNCQEWTRGLFYKADGSVSIYNDKNIVKRGDVVIVRLDAAGRQASGGANIWLACGLVQDYEPLNVELHILGPA